MTAITSYVQLLMRKWKNNTDGFNMQVLSRIEIQAQKTVNMAHNFLSLAKIEDGKIRLRRKKFDLNILIYESAEVPRLLTSKQAIQTLNFAGTEICADRDKIGQVLINLLNNAVKDSPHGGKIIIGCNK